ncbi:MAG: YfiR family protein [Betaproteobacteria bacterium]|nr:YfiR family protein [Betaproteobacteria bacterium]
MGGHSAQWPWRTRALTLIALITGAAGWPGWGSAADNESATLEHRVKAAFLYKIAGYVEWPHSSFAQPDTPITIGVVGAEPVAAELSRISTGRTAQNRPITVRQLKSNELPAGVHILFVGRAESGQLNQLVPKAQQRSILIVTESEGALAQGSAINFVMADGRVRFEVSLGSAEKSKLKLSSRLLAVAQEVFTRAP